MKPILGILIGDATGIGPEVVAKVCASKRLNSYCKPLLIGDLRVLKLGMHFAKVTFPIRVSNKISHLDWEDSIPILNVGNLNPDEIKIGKIDSKSGKATAELFEIGLNLVNDGKISGFSFAPYNKAALDSAGINIYKLFARNLQIKWPFGELNKVKDIWISRVTGHIPLKEVSKRLNKKKIIGTIKLINNTMLLAGVENPRIAVSALNPHGGENGLFGTEEIEIIAPSIKEVCKEGINVEGPFPADTIFISALNGLYDGVVTMFHDQGLIALKLIDFESAVTIIGGISCPITTPAHGTAFDIVGKGIANPSAMEQAIIVAAEMVKRMNKII
jgi:4-hydroxythreonine-4-phosphate dehydrogenase